LFLGVGLPDFFFFGLAGALGAIGVSPAKVIAYNIN